MTQRPWPSTRGAIDPGTQQKKANKKNKNKICNHRQINMSALVECVSDGLGIGSNFPKYGLTSSQSVCVCVFHFLCAADHSCGHTATQKNIVGTHSAAQQRLRRGKRGLSHLCGCVRVCLKLSYSLPVL